MTWNRCALAQGKRVAATSSGITILRICRISSAYSDETKVKIWVACNKDCTSSFNLQVHTHTGEFEPCAPRKEAVLNADSLWSTP
jgi:hypothetical protein